MKLLKLSLTCLFTAVFALPVFAADAVWIDVRTAAEYEAEHLEGTTLIPHSEIAEQIASLNLDKSAPIKLFCRSGGRAGMAKQTLEGLGYSNVENVGGIAEARKLKEGQHHHAH